MFRRFVKYHGSGNDFVVVLAPLDATFSAVMVADICHRQFGVGADGFMAVGPAADTDFKVDYYNADGCLGSLCGNGARCAVDFARSQGLFKGMSCTLEAADGIHHAYYREDGMVSVQFADTALPFAQQGGWFVDTGSPHHVSLVDSIDSIDAVGEGRALRYGVYAPAGANINWMERRGSSCVMRTYERGVENETLSCGTGAVAAALVANLQWGLSSPVSLEALGGILEVAFEVEPNGFCHIILTGPVARVFEGEWTA